MKAPKRTAAARVRSSACGDFRELIEDQFRKVPFSERASHDAQLLRRRGIAPMRTEFDVRGSVPYAFSARRRKGSRRTGLSAAAE